MASLCRKKDSTPELSPSSQPVLLQSYGFLGREFADQQGVSDNFLVSYGEAASGPALAATFNSQLAQLASDFAVKAFFVLAVAGGDQMGIERGSRCEGVRLRYAQA